MPIFTIPNGYNGDGPLAEHGDPDRPGPYPHGRGRSAALQQRKHDIESKLSSAAEVARRTSNEMTPAERANPRFKEWLDKVRNMSETIEERENAVALARAYSESEQGMEGYPLFQADGTPGGSLLKHAGPVNGLTAERMALHDEIVAHFESQFTAPQANPVVVVTGGLPGAGKSFGLRGVKEYESLLNINSDDIKVLLPEYNGTNAAFLHEESDLIASRIYRRAVERRQSMILDVTMKSLGEASKGITNGLAGRLTAMSKLGYEVQLLFTEVSLDTSVRQAVTRFFEHGRFVPPDYIRSARSKGQSASSKNYETFVTLRDLPAVTGWKHYTREFGQGGKLHKQGKRAR